jgi:hypothetical protein
VCVSVHATLILHTIWQDWPLDARDLGPLAVFVVQALGGLGWWAWSLRSLRASEAMARQWTVKNVRGRAQRRAWRHIERYRVGHGTAPNRLVIENEGHLSQFQCNGRR